MTALLLLLHPLSFVSTFSISVQSISALRFLPKPRCSQVERPPSSSCTPDKPKDPLPRPRGSSGGYDRQRPGGFIPTRVIHTLHSSYLPSVIRLRQQTPVTSLGLFMSNLHYLEFQHEFHRRHVLRGSGETMYDPTSSLTIGRDPEFSKPGYLALRLQLSQRSRED